MKIREWWLDWCPEWLERRVRARRYRKVVEPWRYRKDEEKN